MSSNSPALQLAQTDTQYSRMGLILALNRIIRYLIGRNFLMRARTATRFKSLGYMLAIFGGYMMDYTGMLCQKAVPFLTKGERVGISRVEVKKERV